MSTAFDFDDGVGGAGGEHAVDPFADYQQPSAGVGFADDEDEQRPPPLASAPSPSPPTTGDVRHQQTSPAAVSSPSQPTKGSGGQVDDENSPLRVWQREQQERLAERQKKSQEEHDKIRAAARAEIDKFYQERRLQCEKTAQQNRCSGSPLCPHEGIPPLTRFLLPAHTTGPRRQSCRGTRAGPTPRDGRAASSLSTSTLAEQRARYRHLTDRASLGEATGLTVTSALAMLSRMSPA